VYIPNREQKQQRSGGVKKLIFANKKEEDIFLAEELEAQVEKVFIKIFSQ
jgi:hypothetical protein